MELRPIGSNMTEIKIGPYTILFSYRTPVAYHRGWGFYRTDKHYSSTTTKHINKWLNGATAKTVKQEDINSLLSEDKTS